MTKTSEDFLIQGKRKTEKKKKKNYTYTHIYMFVYGFIQLALKVTFIIPKLPKPQTQNNELVKAIIFYFLAVT